MTCPAFCKRPNPIPWVSFPATLLLPLYTAAQVLKRGGYDHGLSNFFGRTSFLQIKILTGNLTFQTNRSLTAPFEGSVRRSPTHCSPSPGLKLPWETPGLLVPWSPCTIPLIWIWLPGFKPNMHIQSLSPWTHTTVTTHCWPLFASWNYLFPKWPPSSSPLVPILFLGLVSLLIFLHGKLGTDASCFPCQDCTPPVHEPKPTCRFFSFAPHKALNTVNYLPRKMW